MSYQREREDFIARMSAEGLPIHVTRLLLREATGLNRRAELACSSEAADRDRVPCPRIKGERYSTLPIAKATAAFERYPCLCDDYPTGTHAAGRHSTIPRITLQDWQAERRITTALPDGWSFVTEGDPRGYVLRVMPPRYAARNHGHDRHNLETIGVPNGPSGLRF
jgi:hypothetical protein